MTRFTPLFFLLAFSLSCQKNQDPPEKRPRPTAKTPDEKTTPKATTSKKTPAAPTKLPKLPRAEPWKRTAPGNIVAIGDVHGDLDAMRKALRAAKVIDDKDDWIGKNTFLVQTGDLLDRGDQEQEIVDLLDKLRTQAREAGGDIVEVIGNHESMNVQGDLRYVTPGGFRDFEGIPGLDLDDPKLKTLPEHARARRAAFLPGGPYAKRLAQHHVITMVNGNVFAHGGVLPKHVSYGIDKINAEMRSWMLGLGPTPGYLQSPDSPMWTRLYAQPDSPEVCNTLQKMLDALGAQRLFVGHTPQRAGVTSACNKKVWRIDVGMARHYRGTPAAIIIEPSKEPRIVTATP